MGIRNFTTDGEEILVDGSLAMELQHLLQERTCELRRRALHLQFDQYIPGWDDLARCCLAGRTVVRLESTLHHFRFPIAYMVEPERKSITLSHTDLPPYSEIEMFIASPNGKVTRYFLLCDEIHPQVLRQHKIEFGFRPRGMFILGVFSAEQANSLIEETWLFLEDVYNGTQTMWTSSSGDKVITASHWDETQGPQANQTLPSQGHPRRPVPFHPILARRWCGPRITAVDDTFDADSGFDPGVERHMQPQLQPYNPYGDIIFLSPGIPDLIGFAQFDRRSDFVEVERIYLAEYPAEPSHPGECREYERRYHRQNPWLYKKVPYNVPQVAQAGVDYPFRPSS
ncbi:uncharacterized protein N7506_012049 [Penicillium brevicompactum]|uniref:uncharacterized protein n=1 Tax=Penicillium brevicompactum TaxID=5074 RepID=UPI0025413610|nr:uncharacterized protein N7506_012049 [Penicillium brevicompactum]KAJ5319345.1 hypothetical protein N7506_012049 [Penicillium brevicompactum]